MNLISDMTCEWPLLASGGENSIEIWNTDFLQFKAWEIHPILLHFPIALLLCGVALELWGMRRPRETLTRAGAGLLLAGMLSGWATAAAGLLAFWTVPAHTEEAHTWMWWHLGFATTMLLFTWLAIVRWRRRAVPSTGGQWFAGLCGAVLLTITGWLGGLIVYHGGAGIDPSLLAHEIREGHIHGAQADPGEESKSGHAEHEHEHEASPSEGHAH